MQNNELRHWGILGMKWGIRRYQNKDGTLTEAGKKRYEKDIRDNLSKKKDNRIDTSNPDPRRWVSEDISRQKSLTDSTSTLVRNIKTIESETSPKATKKRMDLSKMSDQELRDSINREMLERQYNNLFAEEQAPTISKGRQYARSAIDVAGTALTLTGSALSIALAINELKK